MRTHLPNKGLVGTREGGNDVEKLIFYFPYMFHTKMTILAHK